MKKYLIINGVNGLVAGLIICVLTPLCHAQTLSQTREEIRGGTPQKPVVMRISNRVAASPGGFAAEVTRSSFEVHSPNRGLWKGFVRGNGTIHLTLQIIRNGIVESTRYIGSVAQLYTEKPTSFFYTGPLPKGSDWSWTIVAR
ncbi:MAG: hypothetical protein GX589_08405 [Deltaproteobacteria bacterium]|nr:hypothetical protein [Deltaproteobacteria bacterium]